MKHPVLRVRKDAEYYDDSRSGGDSALIADADPEPSRRGRRRAPVFLPLVVLVIVLAAVFQLAPARDTTRFPGWVVRLHATPYGDTLLLTVEFASRAGSAAAGAAAKVRILLPDTGATLDLSTALTPPTTSLRGQLPLSDAVRKVRADITIGEIHRTLSLTVAAKR